MMNATEWRATVVADQPAEWCPIIAIGRDGLAVGVSRDGVWLVGRDKECLSMDAPFFVVGVLPLLEKDPVPTRKAIEAFLQERGLHLRQGIGLLLRAATRGALAVPSSYWAELAMRWLEAFDPDPESIATLEEIAKAPWASQRVRHGTTRLLRRAKERASSDPDGAAS